MFKSIPKIFYGYWDGSNFSYLNYLTVVSFKKHNPDWIIKIYVPAFKYDKNTWNSYEQRDKYLGKNYFEQLKNIVEIVTIDFNDIGFKNEISEVIKSDYLRYYLLGTYGGLWSDMDILYIKSLDSIIPVEFYGDENNIDTVVDFRGHYSVGFLMSNPNNDFFLNLASKVEKSLDINNYQSIGQKMVGGIYRNPLDIKNKHPNLNILNLDNSGYLPIQWNEIGNIFYINKPDKITEHTFGIHWFNGSSAAKRYQNELDSGKHWDKGTIYKYLQEYL